ncbi:unnamed protein product [Effrenium voratum]|nr:unnamed protein product [Effrenium voratum]
MGAVQSNYTLLDWLSSQWPTFRIMHRMQFDLLPREAAVEGGFWMQQDLVPRDPAGRPMRFVFNAGFFRPDALYIDVAADIVSTDMLRTLPAFFGIHMAKPGQRWNLGLAYTSNDYADLIPSKELWRLQAGSQKLLFMPELNELLGEKDQQCRAYYDALQTWRVSKDLADQVGGMPPCFDMPTAADELRAFADTVKDQHVAFVRKPEGAWGGRGIEIRFRVEDVLGDSKAEVSSCEFVPLEDAQCLGLVAAEGHAETAEAAGSVTRRPLPSSRSELDGRLSGGWTDARGNLLPRHHAQLPALHEYAAMEEKPDWSQDQESILREKLLSRPRWRREVQGLARRLLRRRVLMPGWSGEAASVAGLLSKVLVEEHLSCRVAVVQVLPAMWGEVAELIARNQGDPFAGLRSVYRLLRAARPLLAREGPAPGDLRPRQCEAVDFNMGTRWDQPWERASRRFK